LKFATLREAFAVIAVAAIVVPFTTAFWGAAFTISNGYGTNYWIEWRNLGLSNAATAIALLPAFIIVAGSARNWRIKIGWKRLIEAIVLGAGLLATGILVFASQPAGADTSPGLICAPLPFLIWASLRFGPGGTSASLMLGWVLAIWGGMHGRGPFLAHSPTQNTLSLQYFFLVISVPLTFLAVVIKEAENSQTEVRENEAQFRAMTNTAPVMIWKSGTDKRSTFFNQGWLDFTGRTLEQEQGNGWADDVHPEDYDRCLKVYVNSFDARQDFSVECRLRRSDGEYRWILASGVPRFDPYGTFQGYIGSCVDITNSKRAALELQQHRSELAHLSRVTMMGELSGSMAHELNQPLTAILSNAQAALRYLAHESVDLDEVRGILRDIVDQDKRAGEVISRLRVLFKKGEVQFQLLDLNEAIEDVLKLLHSDLVNHGVVVDEELTQGLPDVCGDRIQLQQVLINLIINGCDAMADTSSSERRLSVRTESANGNGVRIAVGDHGCGIAHDRLESVFEPFVTTKSQGMGLGLAVCRTIITAHGGRLWAENNPDAGACFFFMLPLQRKETA
jgi:PAS domain S-box-containing protein